MSVTYEDNNNKEFTNSSHVEGRRKPTATIVTFLMSITISQMFAVEMCIEVDYLSPFQILSLLKCA